MIIAAVPGKKKTTSSFTNVIGDGKLPGLVSVNVNFVLFVDGTGTKSVRRFDVAAINPK